MVSLAQESSDCILVATQPPSHCFKSVATRHLALLVLAAFCAIWTHIFWLVY